MDIQEFSLHNQTDKKDDINDKYEQIKDTQEFKRVEDDYGEFIKSFLSEYGNKSEKELIQDITRLIAEKKRDGTFDAQKIKEVALLIKPFLNESQQAKLQRMLTLLD